MENKLPLPIDFELFRNPTGLHKQPEVFLKNFARFFLKQLYVSDTGIPRHIILKWNRQGLLPSSFRQLESWKRFSVIDYCWLKLLKKMEEMNVPLELRQKASSKLLTIDLDAHFRELAIHLGIGKNEERFNTLEQVKGIIRYNFEDYSEFSLLFFDLLKRNGSKALLLGASLCEVVSWDAAGALEQSSKMPVYFATDFYALNLNELINDFFIGGKTGIEFYQDMQFLTEAEAEVIKALRTAGLREVQIKLDQEGQIVLLSKVKHLEVEKVKKNIRGLSKKGAAKVIEITYDHQENLRVVIEKEQIKFATGQKTKAAN